MNLFDKYIFISIILHKEGVKGGGGYMESDYQYVYKFYGVNIRPGGKEKVANVVVKSTIKILNIRALLGIGVRKQRICRKCKQSLEPKMVSFRVAGHKEKSTCSLVMHCPRCNPIPDEAELSIIIDGEQFQDVK